MTTSPAIDTRTQEIEERMNRVLREVWERMFRAPRFRYWEHKPSGRLFSWTTERANEGKFWAQEWRPVGPGARSGKATEWRVVRSVGFRKRKDAKARALKWYERAQSKGGEE